MDLRHESSVPRALAFHAGWRRRHSQSRRCLGRRQFVSPAGETHIEADDAVRPLDQLPHEWMAMARCLTDGGTTLSSATMPSSPWPQDAWDALPAGIPLNSHEVAQTSLPGAIHSSGLVDHMQLLDRFVVRTPRGLLAWSRHSAPSVVRPSPSLPSSFTRALDAPWILYRTLGQKQVRRAWHHDASRIPCPMRLF